MTRRTIPLSAPTGFAWSDLRRQAGAGGLQGGDAEAQQPDWAALLRKLDQHRSVDRSTLRRLDRLEVLGRLSWISFRLEGLEVQEPEVVEALLRGGLRGEMRPRQAQRLRNHVAILLGIEAALARQLLLTPQEVLRWYTLISAGLSTASLTDAAMRRLEQVCRRVNCPPMRLQAALVEISGLYCDLLTDPLVPSFNGILARLLLRYHLGRCRLPWVVFDVTIDRAAAADPRRMQGRLIALISQQLDGRA